MAGPRRHRRGARVRETAARRYAASPQAGEGPGVLIDSDVVIEILRGRRPQARALEALEASGVRTYCCAVTWAEIFAGLRPGEETLTEGFFEARGEVILDAAVGRRAGSYLARYAASHSLEIADALIAAAASSAGLGLWTLNHRDYPMPNLTFYEPRS